MTKVLLAKPSKKSCKKYFYYSGGTAKCFGKSHYCDITNDDFSLNPDEATVFSTKKMAKVASHNLSQRMANVIPEIHRQGHLIIPISNPTDDVLIQNV